VVKKTSHGLAERKEEELAMKEKEREMSSVRIRPVEEDLFDELERTGFFVPVALKRAESNSTQKREPDRLTRESSPTQENLLVVGLP
jgi:hypothetical protein